MYSLILMTAMSAAPDTTEFNGFFRDLFSFRGGCHGSCTGCYGSCTGRSSGGYGSCTGSGSGCYGNGRLRAFNNNACYGSCTGRTAAGVGSCTGYAASCTGTPSYSCQGSAPMSGMSDDVSEHLCRLLHLAFVQSAQAFIGEQDLGLGRQRTGARPPVA